MTWNLFIVLIGFTVSSRLMWPRVNEEVPSKPEILMGFFTILPRDTLVVSRTPRGMMLIKDTVSTIARLNSMPLMQAGVYKGRLWWLGIPRASLSKSQAIVLEFASLLSLVLG